VASRLVVVGAVGSFGTTDPVVIEVAAAGAAEKPACFETIDRVAFVVVVLVAEMGSKRL